MPASPSLPTALSRSPDTDARGRTRHLRQTFAERTMNPRGRAHVVRRANDESTRTSTRRSPRSPPPLPCAWAPTSTCAGTSNPRVVTPRARPGSFAGRRCLTAGSFAGRTCVTARSLAGRTMPYRGVVRRTNVPYREVVRRATMPYRGVVRRANLPYREVVRRATMSYRGVVRRATMPNRGVVRRANLPYREVVRRANVPYREVVRRTNDESTRTSACRSPRSPPPLPCAWAPTSTCAGRSSARVMTPCGRARVVRSFAGRRRLPAGSFAGRTMPYRGDVRQTNEGSTWGRSPSEQ